MGRGQGGERFLAGGTGRKDRQQGMMCSGVVSALLRVPGKRGCQEEGDRKATARITYHGKEPGFCPRLHGKAQNFG